MIRRRRAIGLSINAGDEIITNLKENDQLGWAFVSEDEAVEGVRSGKYYAAIVIPDNFSEFIVKCPFRQA